MTVPTVGNESVRTLTFAIFDERNIYVYVKETCLRQRRIYNRREISRLCGQNLKTIQFMQ